MIEDNRIPGPIGPTGPLGIIAVTDSKIIPIHEDEWVEVIAQPVHMPVTKKTIDGTEVVYGDIVGYKAKVLERLTFLADWTFVRIQLYYNYEAIFPLRLMAFPDPIWIQEECVKKFNNPS